MADRIGQQLGKYRLTRLLGEGGFAEVYLGEHIHLGTSAAVKILATRLTGADMDAFRTEARLIAHLQHPHIVRVLDFDVEDGIPYLVMDYAPYGTLRTRHPKGVQLTSITILPYIQQVASALQYAHNQHLIHRDVKPENMLVGPRNEILLSDFGIALVAQSSRYQRTQEVVGTVAYMAPEQLQGHPRPASDQYALGVVIYEWLSGTRPFHGTFTEIASQHVLKAPPPLREKLAGISPVVESVVMKALAKQPHQRFADVQAFAMALEQACQTDGTTRVVPPAWRPSEPIITPTPQPSLPPTIRAENAFPFMSGSQPYSAPVVSQPIKQGVSRRVFLGGLAAAAVVAGGASWFALTRGASSQDAGGTTTTSATLPASSSTFAPTASPQKKDTPIPAGQTLFVYRKHADTVYAVAWSPDGRRMASASNDGTVQLWDATNGGNPLVYRGHHGSTDAVAWSPDGRQIASGGPNAQVWIAASGTLVYDEPAVTQVEGIAWSPDGRYIAAASDDTHVYVWEASTGNLIFTYGGHTNVALAVGWSPDSKRIASVSRDQTVQLWGALDGSSPVTYRGHTASVNTVGWSPDGRRVASGSSDGTVRVWDVASAALLQHYDGHAGQVVEGLAWSPDGTRIVSGGRDTTAQVWNPTTGQTLLVYRGHSKAVWAVIWSPDSQRIASGSVDMTVCVWQA